MPKQDTGIRTVLSQDGFDIENYDTDVPDGESIGNEFSDARRTC